MTSETKLIIGGRQSGRTVELIKHSAKTGNTIVCSNVAQRRYMIETAAHLNLSIPEPIVMNGNTIHNDSIQTNQSTLFPFELIYVSDKALSNILNV